MVNAVVQESLGKLKMQHRNFGLMIGELEVAVETMDGDALVNAIDDIALRYQFPIA
jgi:hypothetical protein